MSHLHALLIGIDCYLPNRLPDGSWYESLSGSVRDVERVESFLNELKPQRILKLTASRGTDGQPKEPRESWPIYENIVAAFREVGQGAAPGDQVYIHYSGHGGRTATIFPEIRGEKGYDEGLVPCDIGDPQARYLRGPELADLIQKLVDQQLIVNVVLDCCHSAGMRRSPAKAVRRGLEVVDTTLRPTDSLVASREDLLGLLRRQQAAAPARRNVTLDTPWLIAPKGFVLFAACRPQDCAFEYPFEDGESQGALTYYLLKALREEGASLTFKELHERVYAQVYDQFKYQTPMLAGETDRPFFGAGPGSTRSLDDSSPQGVIVLAVESDRILLNAGQSQGVRKGMRFAIYHPMQDIGESGGVRPQAVVEIEEEGGATESWAKVMETTRSLIRPGAQAVPVGFAPDMARFQGVIGIVEAGSSATQAALKQVRAAVVQDAIHYLRLPDDGDLIDFHVTVNDSGTFVVLDKDSKPIPYLGPPLAIDGVDSISDLVARLIHLTRYRNVLQIENADEESPLVGSLDLKVLGTQKDFTPGDKPRPQPLTGEPPVELRIGEWLFLEITNKSSRILNFAVLDLQPDWGISQVFPSGKDVSFWPLDPGEAKVVRIKAFLPDNLDQGADIIKVFATMGATTYRWMLLPALDTPGRKRHMAVSSFASEEWTAEQLEVRVRR